MKARRILEDAAYGPEELRLMSEAFNRAWLEIAHRYGDSLDLIEDAQLKLAEAVLSVADGEVIDVEDLKRRGLAAMSQYRPTSIPPPQ